jgi:hypothetical protein
MAMFLDGEELAKREGYWVLVANDPRVVRVRSADVIEIGVHATCKQVVEAIADARRGDAFAKEETRTRSRTSAKSSVRVG